MSKHQLKRLDALADETEEFHRGLREAVAVLKRIGVTDCACPMSGVIATQQLNMPDPLNSGKRPRRSKT
jgi:hypothetical protein